MINTVDYYVRIEDSEGSWVIGIFKRLRIAKAYARRLNELQHDAHVKMAVQHGNTPVIEMNIPG